MSIQNILNSRESGRYNAALRKASDGKVTVKVSPNLSLPSKIDVTVKNFGDVLRSLALLGKGIQSVKDSLDKEQSFETDGIIKAIESLKKSLASVPKSTKLSDPVQFPKSFKVDNLEELKSGLVSINDNLVKLAGVIRDNKTEIPGNDDSGVISAVSAVENAIKSMVFPIPTPGTPAYKDSNGAAVSAVISNGAVPVYSPDTDVTAQPNYARKYYTSTGAVTDGIVWSPAAGKRWHVTSLYIQVSADTTLTIEDDLAAGDSALLKGEFKGGSGVVIPFDRAYPLASGEDAADLLVTTSAGNVYITAVGYEV